MLGHAEASSSILSKPFIASSAWSDQVGGGGSRPAAAEMLCRLKIAAAAALNMRPDAGEEGRDGLQVIEAPKRILQPAELL
jgi:hypothetical protein